MIALIDADIIVYKGIYHSDAMYGKNEGPIKHRVQNTYRVAKTYLEEWVSRSGCDEFLMCFSCPSSQGFRRQLIDPEYKANRKTANPPERTMVASMFKMDYPSIYSSGLEADDWLGILLDDDSVCVTIDKDLRQLPGWHLNPDKEAEPVQINEEDAEKSLMIQWMTGDSVDNIPGLWRVGPKTAEKRYALYDNPRQDVLNFWLSKNETEERAMQSYHLLKILTADNIVHTDGQTKVQLFNPIDHKLTLEFDTHVYKGTQCFQQEQKQL